MPSVLPILIPSRSEPINVPCELPDSFTFSAFLPARGVRRITAWLTSCDVKDAEIKDVVLAEPEQDPRGDEWALDSDEQVIADEAAGSVLDGLLKSMRIGMDRQPRMRGDYFPSMPLDAIALAHEAECKAWEALRAVHVAVNPKGWFYVPSPATEQDSEGWVSWAANYLQQYMDRALDDALCLARAKAERQQAEHPRRDDDEDGSERIRAARSLDAPTLKALSWDVDY